MNFVHCEVIQHDDVRSRRRRLAGLSNALAFNLNQKRFSQLVRQTHPCEILARMNDTSIFIEKPAATRAFRTASVIFPALQI